MGWRILRASSGKQNWRALKSVKRIKPVSAAAALALFSAAPALSGEPWAEVRIGYGTYGMATTAPPADSGELYLRDDQGPSWEGRFGYTGSPSYSPGVAITRYSAGEEGRSSSWAASALLAYRTRKPEHGPRYGIDLSLGWVWADFEGSGVEGTGANATAALVVEPQFDFVSIPVFLGIRYATVRDAQVEDPAFPQEGTLDYSGVFLGVGARFGWTDDGEFAGY